MTPWLLVALDLVLALGAALRLTRFITTDEVPGGWWIKEPLWKALGKTARLRAEMRGDAVVADRHYPKVTRYMDGLSCPYCMSVWMSAVVTVTLLLAGGAGDAADWWRYPAGFLTLAWLTGHIAARAGDTED